MAKKIPGATQSAASQRIQRTEAYAGTVKRMFDETVNDILKLKLAKPTEEGVMYSFDGDTIQVRKRVEELLKRLHSSATLAVKKGIQAEWGIANREMDNLVKATFGKKLFESDRFRAWTAHNEDAMNAFVNRTDKGMNLSDRVWQASRQLRDEMEVALTVGMGSGESAASMSRAVRQCLNDPDLMFRRFRYKKGEDENGNPIYGKKWKKKVIVDGKTKWIDYDKDSYIPKGAGGHSRGVYKSAAKNAMRVARTETNMAYRRADYERWQKMDFVLGIRIELSNQHPIPDICDDMQGDYPKNFYFGGWHVNCFCYATPILVSEDEMAKVTEEFMEGRTYVPKGEPILDTPPAFKQWVADNSDRIRNASSLPYWIKDNPQFLDARKGVALTPDPDRLKAQIEKKGITLTPEEARDQKIAEAAKKRHDARPEGYREELLAKRQLTQDIDALLGKAEDFGWNANISSLKDALHDMRFSKDAAITTEKLQKEYDALKESINKQKKILSTTAANLEKLANKYGYSQDIKALADAMSDTQTYTELHQKQRELAKAISAEVKDNRILTEIIPDVEKWKGQFTSAEVHKAHDAIKQKLESLKNMPLEEQKKQLAKELKYCSDPTYLKPHKLHSTWEIANTAYARQLQKVEVQIKTIDFKAELAALKTPLTKTFNALSGDIKDAEQLIQQGKYTEAEAKIAAAKQTKDAVDKYNTLLSYHTPKFDTLMGEAKAYLENGDLKNATAKLSEAEKLKAKNEASKASKAAKKAASAQFSTTYTDDQLLGMTGRLCTRRLARVKEYGLTKNEIADYNQLITYAKKGDVANTKKYLAKLKIDFNDTYGQARKDGAIWALDGMDSYKELGHQTAKVWLDAATTDKQKEAAFAYTYEYNNINEPLRGLTYIGSPAKTKRGRDRIPHLTDLIENTSLENDMWFQRGGGLVELKKFGLKNLSNPTDQEIMSLVGAEGNDGAFISTGSARGKGFPGQVLLNIYAPRGTKGLYVEPFSKYGMGAQSDKWDGSLTQHMVGHENEFLLQRGTRFKITKVEKSGSQWYIDVEIVEQNVLPFPYVGGYPYK